MEQTQDDLPPVVPALMQGTAPFWFPRYVVRSAESAHLPYLFWVLQTLRPVSIMQIGLADGAAYLAMCQAVKRLGLKAKMTGVNWPIATPSLPTEALLHHAQHYAGFSQILSTDPVDLVKQGPTNALDLLIVTPPFDQTLQAALQAIPALAFSDRGLVVILGLPDAAPPKGLALGGFGKSPIVTLALPNGCSSHSILVGTNAPTEMRSLADRSSDIAPAQHFFGALGAALERSCAEEIASAPGIAHILAQSDEATMALTDSPQPLASEVRNRIEDIAILTRYFEDRHSQDMKIQQDLRQHLAAVLSSTSWKITAPLRKLVTALRGR